MPTQFPELERLPPDEKMILAAELWNEAACQEESLDPDPEIVAVLEERMEQYRRNPETALTWEEVREQLRRDG